MARPSNADARRVQILEAFRDVLGEHGYDGATIARIARAAGLTPGLLHYHFGSKQAILVALVEDLVGRARARIDARLEAASRDPEARVGAILAGLLDDGDGADPEAVACWAQVGAEAIRNPVVRVVYQEWLAQLAEELTAALDGDADLAAGLVVLVEGYFAVAAAAPGIIRPGSAGATAIRMMRGAR